jgi:hypothetical protein
VIGASLVIGIQADDDDDDDVLQVYCAALAVIRPQLVGAIVEDADRVLAAAAEVRTSTRPNRGLSAIITHGARGRLSGLPFPFR